MRRIVATLGMIALAPVALGVLKGTLSPAEAATRAAITMASVVVVGRIAAWATVVVEAQRVRASSAASTTAGSNAEPVPSRSA
jgi:hypothetical protein